MNANATPDLRKLPPAGTSPAHQDASCPRSDIPFTPIEAAFLKLFARDDIFGGIAPALAEVVDALQAAHRVYGLERYRKWADGAAQFERRVEALEAQGRPELGLPSTDEENLTPGDMLSRLEDNSLDADELLRIRALFGARIAGALSKNEILPRSAVAAHESLLICRRNRSRQHEDWRTVCGHADVDETGLRALKLVVKSTVVRDFIDDSLMALAGAIVDPSASAAAPQAPTAEPGSSQEPDSDHEDPTEHGYGQPADIEIPRVTGVDAGATSRQEREQAAPDQPPADGKISLIGWRIVDGLHAPFTRRLGITTTWGASPLADHASVCRSLKHDFTVGDLVHVDTELAIKLVLSIGLLRTAQHKLKEAETDKEREERDRAVNAHRDAEALSRDVKSTGFTIEDFHKGLAKFDSPELVRRMLLSPTAASKIVTADSKTLNPIHLPTKKLNSEISHRVRVAVMEVSPNGTHSMVKLTWADQPGAVGLKDLFKRPIRLEYRRFKGIANLSDLLLSLRLARREAELIVTVTRALRPADKDLDLLVLKEFCRLKDLAAAVPGDVQRIQEELWSGLR